MVIGLIVTTETQAQALGGCSGKAPLVFPRGKVGMVIGRSQLLQIDPVLCCIWPVVLKQCSKESEVGFWGIVTLEEGQRGTGMSFFLEPNKKLHVILCFWMMFCLKKRFCTESFST